MRGAMRRLLILVLLLVLAEPSASWARGAMSIRDGGVIIDYPNSITFRAQLESTTAIGQVVLEYGVDKQTCATVSASAFPVVPKGKAIDVHWTWNMHESGSEPPGATIWYRWLVTDKAGHQQRSPIKRVTWIDTLHPWGNVSRAGLTLHWY